MSKLRYNFELLQLIFLALGYNIHFLFVEQCYDEDNAMGWIDQADLVDQV